VKFKRFICAILIAQHAAPTPTPLATLLAEAEANNSQLQAADDAWKAQAHVARQLTALPDPQFSVESLGVGSPKPFAGFTNSEFAYVGLGASQDLPYRGKLKLRGEVATRDTETEKAGANVVRSLIAEQVKLLYLQIAYSIGAIAYIDRADSLLQSLIQDALLQYSVGKGAQSSVIKAQMEHTRLLREDTVHRMDLSEAQARLKQLLHRSQQTPDILPEPLTATPLLKAPQELEGQLRAQNPALRMDADAVQKQDAQVASANRERLPDFNVGYNVELTGDGYRNRYVLSASMRLPNRSRVAAEIAQASQQEIRAKHLMDFDAQQKLAELQEQLVAANSTAELLKEYNDGLIPQAEALFHSEQSAYQSNKQDLAPVLSALLDILTLQNECQQVLRDHETALVKIETLTGGSLR